MLFKSKKIDVPIYPIYLHIVVTDSEKELTGYLGEESISMDEYPGDCKACVFADKNNFVLFLNCKGGVKIETMAHEVIHIIEKLRRFIGDSDSPVQLDETFAYHVEYFFGLVFDFCLSESEIDWPDFLTDDIKKILKALADANKKLSN